MTPTQRSLDHLRGEGYTADIVERFIPGANVRRDFLGIIDIIALRAGETLAVQTTSGSNLASRRRKLEDSATIGVLREAGWRVVCHGWRKSSKGRWVLREVDLS